MATVATVAIAVIADAETTMRDLLAAREERETCLKRDPDGKAEEIETASASAIGVRSANVVSGGSGGGVRRLRARGRPRLI